MNYSKLFLVASFLLGINTLKAQEISPIEAETQSTRKNKVSVNILNNLIYNVNNIEFERSFENGKSSIGFYIGQTGQATPIIDGYYSRVSEQNVSYNRYSKSFERSSFWYGGTFALATGDIWEKYDPNKQGDRGRGYAYNISTLSLNARCGYQVILKSFYLNPYVSLGYAFTNNLFGTAKFVGDATPVDVIIGYGLKTGILF